MVAANFLRIFQNDLFFDLKTGEDILKHGIDFMDHFSFIKGLPYLYHHYLYDIIVFFIYKYTGYNGIFIFFLCIFFLFGISLYVINKKTVGNRFLSLLVTMFVLYISRFYFSSRVQSITYLLFLLEVYFINRLYEEGNKKYSILIVLIGILIVNLHMPIWFLSIVFFLPFMFESAASKNKLIASLFLKKIVINKPKSFKLLLITFITMLFTGLITPLRHYAYTFIFNVLGNSSYLFIGEMQKTVLIDLNWNLFLIVLFIILLLFNKIRIKLRDLCLVLGLFLFSLIALRNVVYFYIFAPIIIIKMITENIELSNLKFDKINKWFSRVNKNTISLFSLFGLIIISVFCFYNLDLSNENYGINDNFPVETVKYIKNNLDYKNIKMFNDFDYGSYIEFNDIPAFIDSRAEVYIKEFNGGYDIVGDYSKTDNYHEYKKVFNKYKFDYALCYRKSNLYYYLKKDKDFKITYKEKDKFVLFKKLNDK